MGTSSINGPFSMAMLNNQMVIPHEKNANRTFGHSSIQRFQAFLHSAWLMKHPPDGSKYL